MGGQSEQIKQSEHGVDSVDKKEGILISVEQLKTMRMLLSNCIFAEEEGYISKEDVSVLYNKQDKMLWDLSDMLEIDGNNDFFNIHTLDLYTIQ